MSMTRSSYGLDTDPADTWRQRAACQGLGVAADAFFPPEGSDARDAKRLCRHCDVRAECLAWALEHERQFGIWGGTTPRERAKMLRCRQGQCQHREHRVVDDAGR